MKIQAYSNTNVHSSYNAQNNPSFKGVPNPGKFRRAFEWLGDQCNISSNGSLTRAMFFVVLCVPNAVFTMLFSFTRVISV